MTDWWQMMRAANPRNRYLSGRQERPDVERTAKRIEGARADAAGPAAPDWAEALSRRRASRVRAQTPEERARARSGTGANRWRGEIRGGSGVVIPDIEPVPFSLVAGTDDTPAGDDFAAWYRQTTAPRNRLFMQEEAAPVEDEAPLLPSRGREPASGPEGSIMEDDRTGIVPAFDPAEAWAEAVLRAEERAREAQPNNWDALFRLVFGQRGGMTAEQRQADELLEEVRGPRAAPTE